ncbi:MAG: DUF1738 domain-containing protein [Bacteroidales bacterium]|nr:DUF1738 domain-containing protein [Bacteroidales bacterium]
MKRNLFEQVTQQVIDNLEKVSSWKRLWEVPQPVSLNGHHYQGINYLLLSTDQFTSPVWGTFNQVRQNGGCVNKGEKSRLVVFWKRLIDSTTDKVTGEAKQNVHFLLRYYLVFNVEQCSFDDIGKAKINTLSRASESLSNERNIQAEEIIGNMPDPPQIRLGMHDTPSYIPSLDVLEMPDKKYFFNSDAYYAAFFHELIHSTGHKKRLNRFESDQFRNNENYSKEELVAELGAAYLQTVAGINYDAENTAAYIKGWLRVLKDNPTWITWAASRAQKACEFIVPALAPENICVET